MRAIATGVLGVILGFAAPVPGLAEEDRQSVARDQRAMMDLFDVEADVETRRALLAKLENEALADPDPQRLYLLGTLYRRGDNARQPAYAPNLDKAREYLSRAALAGMLSAMAKMSVLELDAGNRFEANVWAQLHYHYWKDAPLVRDRWSDGFSASLIARAKRGFDDADIPALNDSVGLMINNYDAKIRAGMERQGAIQVASTLQPTRSDRRVLPDMPAKRPTSGVAEYYVAFDAKGEVDRLWLLDAWPDPALARVLRPIAMSYRVKAEPGSDPRGELALLPIEYNDLKFQIRQRD